ncbi:hypothetical protein CRENBAI_024831, partial [Crenichthys baileyi]
MKCLGLRFFKVLTLGFSCGVQTIDISLTSTPRCSTTHGNLPLENNFASSMGEQPHGVRITLRRFEKVPLAGSLKQGARVPLRDND